MNSAKYFKVGQSIWVDRKISNSVLNRIYSFHASGAAYTEYWNNSFGIAEVSLIWHHIWQAFIQESICTISAAYDINLELKDGLPIEEVITEAFAQLGDNGLIQNISKDREASDMEIDHAPVKMVVFNGIVIGLTHCAFDNCTADLDNYQGAFCANYKIQFGAKCCVCNCQNNKIKPTQACNQHQGQ